MSEEDAPGSNEPEPTEPAPQRMAATSTRPVPAESQRIYVDAPVNFKVEGGRAATGFVRDLSMTGLFIGTDTLYLTGTEIDFSIRVGASVIEGSGRVVWQRAAPSSRNLPIGIGVSFDRLDPDSRLMVRHLVDGTGGSAWRSQERVEGLREAVSAGLDASSSWLPIPDRLGFGNPHPAAYPAERSRAKPGLGTGVWTVLAIAGIFVGGLLLQQLFGVNSPAAAPAVQGLGAQPAQAGDEELAPSADRPSEATPEVDLASDAATVSAGQEPQPANLNPPPAQKPAADSATQRQAMAKNGGVAGPGSTAAGTLDLEGLQEQIRSAVAAWSLAWSSQNVDDYLDRYIPTYSPSESLNASSWREQRHDRLTRPSIIEVEVSELEVSELDSSAAGAMRAQATFRQRYRSDQFRDEVRKTLEFEKTDAGWKILRETSRPVS